MYIAERCKNGVDVSTESCLISEATIQKCPVYAPIPHLIDEEREVKRGHIPG